MIKVKVGQKKKKHLRTKNFEGSIPEKETDFVYYFYVLVIPI